MVFFFFKGGGEEGCLQFLGFLRVFEDKYQDFELFKKQFLYYNCIYDKKYFENYELLYYYRSII